MTNKQSTAAIILAAGKGTRMKSRRAKVLFNLAEKTLVEHVADTAAAVDANPTVVVVGYRKDEVVSRLHGRKGLRFTEQTEQLGTGHAVMVTREALAGFAGDVFILCGDVPLLQADTLRNMLSVHRAGNAACTVLTAILDDPARYGRIVRDTDGNVRRIVEYKDATEEQRAICEINTGIYCFDAVRLFAALDRVSNDNQQNEYYLTDTLEILGNDGEAVISVLLDDMAQAAGINSQAQLAALESEYYSRIKAHWLDNGVVIEMPDTVLVGAGVSLARDVAIASHCVLKGDTTVGEDSVIGHGCLLQDATLEQGCFLAGHNIVKGCTLAAGTRLDYGENRQDG
ncbi:MAG: NTP transferase domain-containing protein [Candidatus Cloacimonetes bacterium]|nr:NTP transferase domain-containing protein [Candidatus Cloacimonadota bacterium]